MGLGPLITGYISEHFFEGPSSLGKALAVVTAVSLVVGVGVILIARKAIIAAVHDNDRKEAAVAAALIQN